jgi:hypothetical protein
MKWNVPAFPGGDPARRLQVLDLPLALERNPAEVEATGNAGVPDGEHALGVGLLFMGPLDPAVIDPRPR